MFSKQKTNKHLNLTLFVLLVALPWFAIIGYTLTVAKPRYVSIANVIIKQMEQEQTDFRGLSSLLTGTSTSKEDALHLINYITSKDMLNQLDKHFNLRKHYRLDGNDIINELPAKATNDQLHQYLQKRVHVDLDNLSLIITIKTESFTPEHALALNQAILHKSEHFINSISRDALAEQIALSEKQLKDAEEKFIQAKQALIDYQKANDIATVRPTASAHNQIANDWQKQLANLRNEEAHLLSYLKEEAPQVIAIRSQIQALDKKIQDAQSKATLSDNQPADKQNSDGKNPTLEDIQTNISFADDNYKIALASVEKARLEALRKMKKLIIISSPHKADEATYPRHAYIIAGSLLLLLMIYVALLLIFTFIRRHHKAVIT